MLSGVRVSAILKCGQIKIYVTKNQKPAFMT